LFDLNSHEIENKLRIDVNKYLGGWKLSYGLGTQYVKYDADIFNTVQQELRDENNTIVSPELTVNSNAAIDFFKFGASIHSSKYLRADSVLLSAGVRSDMNSFTNEGFNPLKPLSPRLSASYVLNKDWDVSASIGSYYKLPSYTALGYVDANNNLV